MTKTGEKRKLPSYHEAVSTVLETGQRQRFNCDQEPYCTGHVEVCRTCKSLRSRCHCGSRSELCGCLVTAGAEREVAEEVTT